VWETPEARGAGGTRQGMRRCVGALPAVDAIGSGGRGDRRAGRGFGGGMVAEATGKPKNDCGAGF
jgi:hypothetical protein